MSRSILLPGVALLIGLVFVPTVPAAADEVDGLIRLIRDPQQPRHAIADAITQLRELGDPRTIEPLKEMARNDRDDRNRCAAIQALSFFQGPGIVDVLLEALTDTEVRCRWEAIDALTHFDDTRAIKPVLTIFLDRREAYPHTLFLSSHYLGFFGDSEVVAAMLTTLNDRTDPRRRALAATVLGKLGAGMALEPLLDLLNDTEAEVRSAAVQALGNLGDTAAVEPLIRVFRTDTNREMVLMAVASLNQLCDQRALPPLREALADTRWLNRIEVVLLHDKGDSPYVTSLLDAATDPSWVQRFGSDIINAVEMSKSLLVNMLYQIESTVAIISTPVYFVPTHDDTALLVSWLTGWLQIEEPDMAPRLTQLAAGNAGKKRLSAAAALYLLGEQPDQQRERLVTSLATSSTTLRQEAACLLGIIGDSRAIAPLLQSLADPDHRVREAAATALSIYADSRVEAALLAAIQTEDLPVIRGAYYWFICRGDPASEPLLAEVIMPTAYMITDYRLSGNARLVAAVRRCLAGSGFFYPWQNDAPRWGAGTPVPRSILMR